MIDSRARLTAPPIYSVQITAVMSYYHQNGYRSQEKQYDKPETMGTDHPARLRIDRINILNYTEYCLDTDLHFGRGVFAKNY